jgi:hypothetical protein
MDIKNKLTVCIPTSVVPSPGSTLVEYVIELLLTTVPSLCGCSIIISYDYNPVRYGKKAEDYKDHLIRLSGYSIMGSPIKTILSSPKEGCITGQRESFLSMAGSVKTKYMFHFEHDWKINSPISIYKLIEVMDYYDTIKYVSMNKKTNIRGGGDYILEPATDIPEVDLLRSTRYSNNPHIARTDHWVNFFSEILKKAKKRNTHVSEIPIYSKYVRDVKTLGFKEAHKKWGVFVYGKLGDPPTISHLNGKKWMPKNGCDKK